MNEEAIARGGAVAPKKQETKSFIDEETNIFGHHAVVTGNFRPFGRQYSLYLQDQLVRLLKSILMDYQNQKWGQYSPM